MKTKVALVLIVLLVVSLLSFGRGHNRHGRHERNFHKQEIKFENKKQKNMDCKFVDQHKKMLNCKFNDEKNVRDHKDSNKRRSNFRGKEMNGKKIFRQYKNNDLSFIGNSVLLETVYCYGTKS